MKPITKPILGLATAIALIGVAASRNHNDDDRSRPNDNAWKIVVFDVACDGRTYVANGVDPATGKEVRGSTFIVNGNIYPGGTIPRGDGFDLDATPGSIGKWVCRGTWNMSLDEFLAGGAPPVSSVWQILFDSTNALMTEGSEGGEKALNRVVLGGTGRYRGVVGECKEELLGFNTTGFENYRFTFRVRQAAH